MAGESHKLALTLCPRGQVATRQRRCVATVPGSEVVGDVYVVAPLKT